MTQDHNSNHPSATPKPATTQPSLAGDYLERFSGVARLYSLDGLVRLHNAHVCVVGLGGVGTWAAEALARSGVGALTLIDLDDICITNVNRQLHALDGSIGQSKADALAQRMRLINPSIHLNVVHDFITANNVATHITNELDYVIDCIDSVKHKAALIAHCKRHKVRIVTTGGAGGQIDPTSIHVLDLNKTYNDPLARKVRSLLRREYGFSRNEKRNYSVPCVCSSEQLRYPQPDGSVCQQKSFDGLSATNLNCSSGFGSSTMVTASFGMTAAARVITRLAQASSKKS